jgi:outer membrane immunogenic protein
MPIDGRRPEVDGRFLNNRKWGAALKIVRSLTIYAVALAILTPFAGEGVSSARADDADLAQVLKTLKALESRVATLESENQQYRRETASARAETQALKLKLGHQPGPAAVPLQLPPSSSYAMVIKTPIPAAVPTWGGFYAGASFGLTSQRANQDGVEPQTLTFESVQLGSSNTSVTSVDTTSSLGGRGLGTMANLYLGYNYMLPSNFLVGAQIEGGVSNTRTTLTGLTSGPQMAVSTVTFAGVTTTSTLSGTTSGNTAVALDNRWAMSALVRGGLVVDPKDLIYLVGGLSYGRFEFGDQSFGAFGGTVGAGWERKITPSWTLKAEYRYTRFQDRTVTENSSVSSSISAPGSTNTTSSVILDTSRFSGLDWHTVSVGVSHYFDAN